MFIFYTNFQILCSPLVPGNPGLDFLAQKVALIHLRKRSLIQNSKWTSSLSNPTPLLNEESVSQVEKLVVLWNT